MPWSWWPKKLSLFLCVGKSPPSTESKAAVVRRLKLNARSVSVACLKYFHDTTVKVASRPAPAQQCQDKLSSASDIRLKNRLFAVFLRSHHYRVCYRHKRCPSSFDETDRCVGVWSGRWQKRNECRTSARMCASVKDTVVEKKLSSLSIASLYRRLFTKRWQAREALSFTPSISSMMM